MSDSPDMLRQRAESEIRARILDGRLAFGARLSDRGLAASLGIGRTPVREALSRLAEAGLVDVRPKSGSIVWSPDAAGVRDLCDMRAILECGALRLAAGRDPDRLAAALARPLAGASLALEYGDLARAEAMDSAFHEALVQAAGNAPLADAYRAIADKLRALRHRLERDPDRMTRAVAQHRRILDLALTNRVAEAQTLLASHVGNVRALLTELVPG